MNSSNSSRKKRGPDTTITKFLCKLCPKNVSDNDNAILCDICQTWVYIKCNHLNYIDQKYLQGFNKPWYCLSCTSMLSPFGNLTNKNVLGFISSNNNSSNNNNNNNNNNKNNNNNNKNNNNNSNNNNNNINNNDNFQTFVIISLHMNTNVQFKRLQKKSLYKNWPSTKN